jgi:ribosome-associated protein
MELGEVFCRMPTEQALPQTRLLVQAAAAVCEDKKGQDTRILELDPADAGLSDFFLVTSATNDRQAIAIADEIEQRLKRAFGVYPNSVEGRRHGEWILLDYVDFVVHVFLAERRAFYDIERLRKSARPLTPAEFDSELKAALAARTRAVRDRKPAKHETAGSSPEAGNAAKKAAKKSSSAGAERAVKGTPAGARVRKAPVKRAGARPVAKAKHKLA